MGKHVVFVGGGHAHLTALLNTAEFIRKGHRVTLISPAPYHYYSGMGPGMLAQNYRPQDIRFHIKKMVEDRGAVYVNGRVTQVDPIQKSLSLDSGTAIGYDFVSFNIGSHVPRELSATSANNVFAVKPIENLIKAQKATRDLLHQGPPRVLVIGGGPAGLELSGNIWRLIQNHGQEARITLVCGRKLLFKFLPKVRRLALESLTRRGIEVLEDAFAQRLEPGGAVLADGRKIAADLILLAWGVRPPDLFRKSGLPVDQQDGLLVNDKLQSIQYPDIFGGGDCVSFKPRRLDKVGVYPVRQNPILYHNLMAAASGAMLQPFKPQSHYMLLFNLGDGRAIFCRRNWVWQGRLAFYLKDYIDQKFMRRFQVSGERQEEAKQL
ncbi:MAG: FAD-dependent oxidoreductase [Desulfobacterales bacterium]|nr:MAG: FAD-dependent oxidoreductase [Desulfobacterales bacterium]